MGTQIVPTVSQPISIQQLKIPVNLSSSNWEQWSTFVVTGLDSLRKGSYLTEESQTTGDWKAEDSSIRMILWNAMEPDILSTVHTFKTTKKMWDHLKSTYSTKTSMAHAYAISQAHARCEQGDATLTEYFTKFKKLSDEMSDLFPFGADSTTVWEQLNTLTFIGGMSSRYSSARPILLGQTTIPSLSATYHLLREMFPSDGTGSSPITENSALVANSYKGKSTGQSFVKGGRGSEGTSNSSSNKNVQCRYCKEWGHMKWDCPKRPKGSPHPPRAQVATVDQSHSERTNSDEVATLVQRLEQLGFSRADMTSQPQTPRATLAHPGTGDEQIDWHCI
ncbi:uncharacterized protein LOC144561167 [Carex rostrata]